MFKSQGLFKEIPCPDSSCTFDHCPFVHTVRDNEENGSEGSSSTESGAIKVIDLPHKRSSFDEGRSRKKRIITKSPPTLSDKREQGLKSTDQDTDTAQPQSQVSPSQSVSQYNMISVLPVTASVPISKPALTQSDMKRKYTDTFNVAAKEYVPAPTSPTTPTVIEDSAIHSSINQHVRRIPLEMIFKAYVDLYDKLPNSHTLASRDAVKEEFAIAKTSPNARTYQVAWKQLYSKLKKRPSPTSVEEACTMNELEKRQLE